MKISFPIFIILSLISSFISTNIDAGSSVVIYINIKFIDGTEKKGSLDIKGYDKIFYKSYYDSRLSQIELLEELKSYYKNSDHLNLYSEINYHSCLAPTTIEKTQIKNEPRNEYTLGYCLRSNYFRLKLSDIDSIQILDVENNPRNWLETKVKIVDQNQFNLLKRASKSIDEISLDIDDLKGYILLDFNDEESNNMKLLKQTIKVDYINGKLKTQEVYENMFEEIILYEYNRIA